jgi:peptidoglycan/xylan/chitin deacetylase (PgdA/CDA1 family)
MLRKALMRATFLVTGKSLAALRPEGNGESAEISPRAF